MGVTISSYPPLGQITQLKGGIITFVVTLNVEARDVSDDWEVALWYSTAGRTWEEATLSACTSESFPISLQAYDSARRKLHFHGSVGSSSNLSFTIKYRNRSDQTWRWIREEHGLLDGTILVNPEYSPRYASHYEISDVIQEMDPDLKVKSASSQTPHTQLWTIEASVIPSGQTHSTYCRKRLGKPWGEFLRYFALVRHGPPWLGPRHGKSKFNVDKDAVMCSFLNVQGKHLVLLGVSSVAGTSTVLQPSVPSSDSVMLYTRNDGSVSNTGLVLAAVGDNMESAIAAVMYHARTVVGATMQAPTDVSQRPPHLKGDDIGPSWYEEWYDGLGYCTWNALGQHLTENKILEAANSLAENNINVSTFVIDDNWQDIDESHQDQYQRGWKGFEAHPEAFPSGLKNTVARIRSRLPSIEQVAVWHALLGYWGGISPDSELARNYRTVTVERDQPSSGGAMTVVAKEDVEKFYDDFYRFLSNSGINAVKTDVQYMITTLLSAQQRRELTNTYLDAWIISALRHFSLRAISCMSQAPHILFHQQMPRNKPVMLARNSDDFFPDVPASHPWHIFANAHNTLFTQHLNILPDWDMFQTGHELGGFHAAARCVSGGPIYITDIPGKHDLNLIKQMTGTTPRGRTVIFRPNVVGKSIDQAYTGYDEDYLLKIGSYHGRAVTGTPIIGFFNTRQRYIEEIIHLNRFPGVIPLAKYVVRAHSSGLVSPVVSLEGPHPYLTVSLGVRGYDIFTAYPITQFDSETNGRIFTANLGLIEKMTGAAAIMTNHSELLHTGKVFVDTRLKALGVMGLYVSSLPDMSLDRDFIVTIQGSVIPRHTVKPNKSNSQVLEIDVETAWNEMGLEAGWSNEVELKVWFDIEHP
ncbi:glycoside hydrolase family 36 protein [Xylariomycetidae sp. FL2044]|nr:glycoside hydrolase family 36 protein [Xylariomycetidae sp. FL2044]